MKFLEIIKKRKSKQVLSLYLSMSLSLFIGIGVSVINTRVLGAENYGNFKFILNLLSFIFSFITFGFFYSGGRLIAQKENNFIKNKLINNIIIITVYITIVFLIIVFIFSYLQDIIYKNNLGYLIRIILPLLFVLPFQRVLENILQGENSIYTLSIFRLGPKALYLFIVISLNLLLPFKLLYALIIHFGSLAFFIVIILFRIKPKLKSDKKIISIIIQENKSYGFHVYIGAITGVASSYLAGLSLGYFLDNTYVGYFSLAMTATMPLAMIPNAIGTTFFKEFTKLDKIPKQLFIYTGILSFSILMIFLLSIDTLVNFLYSEKFKMVVPLSYFTSVAAVSHGLGDLFNRFLAAHGLGKKIRDSNFQLGIINVLGYIFLIYFFGVYGAVLTKLIAGFYYLVIMIIYYLNHIKKRQINE